MTVASFEPGRRSSATLTDPARAAASFLNWRRHPLVFQFFLIGGVVALLCMLVVGSIVVGMIQRTATRNAGAATALYVDGLIAPLLPDMSSGGTLQDPIKRALDETLNNGALRDRVAGLRLVGRDGRILYSEDPAQIGRTAEITPQLMAAFAGSLQSHYEPGGKAELGRVLNGPILTIANPVLQPWSGAVVAVVEVVEFADDLAATMTNVRRRAWLAVLGTTFMFFMALSAIVIRGSRTIVEQADTLEGQVATLTALVEENRQLRVRVQDAAEKSATLNERFLRRLGADLHDGPAQLISLASLRLDSPLISGDGDETDPRGREIGSIRAHLHEALDDIRGICRGLVLPQIESADVHDTVLAAIEDHERRTGNRVERALERCAPAMPVSHRICMYRFVQEALNNSHRHVPHARQTVTLSCRQNRISISAGDDGLGFDPRSAEGSGIGLAGMRERVQSLGGTFTLATGPRGTQVTMDLAAGESQT